MQRAVETKRQTMGAPKSKRLYTEELKRQRQRRRQRQRQADERRKIYVAKATNTRTAGFATSTFTFTTEKSAETAETSSLYSRRRLHFATITDRSNRGFLVFAMAFLFSASCLVDPSHGDWLMDCGDCHCKWNSGKKTADCKNLSLVAVPENLSNEVQVLDLSLNRIAYLEQNAFLTADLHNLHKLYIRNSSLQQIDPRTFTQLEILIELDMSNNLLRSLQANVFARLVKVRALVLNGNLLEALDDGVFQNLKYLHKVELKDNRLKRIASKAFLNVPLLSQIYLDNNRFNYLRKESFETLKRLTALSLDGNPWNCTCELQVFRDFVVRRKLYTPPTACYYPTRLRGMLWIDDQPEAFACKPKIMFPAKGASISTSKENVTLICRVHASPNTLIVWDYNKQMYRSNALTIGGQQQSQQQRIHIQLLRDELTKEKEFGREVFISRLTITGTEKSDEGMYTCVAENPAGKDSVQMSLIIEKPSPRELLIEGNLAVVICLMALGLLSVSVFLAMVTCCLYKRFKQMNANTLHHHHMSDQLTSASHTTTTVAGGTEVVLSSSDDPSITSLKHHFQKNGLGVGIDKYSEVIRRSAATVIDGGGGGGGGGVGSSGDRGDHPGKADIEYMERNKEDTLYIKYPHGYVKAEVPLNNSNRGANRAFTEANGEVSGGGRNVEYQPDLLPADCINKANSSGYDDHHYSPVYVQDGKTINQQDDKQQQKHHQKHHLSLGKDSDKQQEEQPPVSVSVSAPPPPPSSKSKYNKTVQEYLQSKYNTLANSGKSSYSSQANVNSKVTPTSMTLKAKYGNINSSNSNSGRHDVLGIPLTTSASLTVASSITAGGGRSAQESGFTSSTTMATLQRHTKSLAISPNATAMVTTHHRFTTSTASPLSTPPTENTSYEYRQPPPPPYNAVHRTASGFLSPASSTTSSQRRSGTLNDNNDNSKDPTYRDVSTKATATATAATTTATDPAVMVVDYARQTIVTASPSLNFLTTTGYAPQKQLL